MIKKENEKDDLARENARLRDRIKQLETQVRSVETPHGGPIGAEALRVWADTAPVGIFLLRGDSLLYLNPAMAALSGLEPRELAGRSWWSLIHPDDLEAIRKRLSGYPTDQATPPVFRCRFINAAGETKWVQSHETFVDFEGEQAVLGFAWDITDWVESEHLLTASEEKYRVVVESAGEAIFTIDREGKFLFMNGEAARQLGGKPQDFVGRSQWDVFPRELADRQIKAIRTVLESGEGFSREVPTVMPGGDRHFHHTTGVPVRKLDGQIVAVLCIARDVTELVQARDALSESEAKYSRLMKNLPVGVIQLSPDSRIEAGNAALARMYGYDTIEEYLGASAGGNVLDPARRKEMERELAEKGYVRDFEVEVKRKDGSIFWDSISARVRYDQTGQPAGIDGVEIDITARKLAELKFERLFRSNPALMALSTFPDNRFVDVNDVFLASLGYSVEEVIGKTAREMSLFPTSDSQAEAARDRIIAGGRIQDVELQVRRKDGELLDGIFSGEVIVSQGQRYFLTLMIDISERKRAEEALRLHSLALDQISDHVTITDLDGRIVFVNQAAAETHGRSKAELIGQHTTVYGEDREKGATQREIVERTLRDGFWRGEVVNYGGDGRELIVDCRTQVVRDENGKPVALCGIATNITARKRAEQALTESEQLFRALAESAPAVIVIYQGEEIVYANPQLLKVLDLKPADLGAVKFWELIAPEFQDQIKATGMARQRGEEVPASYEVKVLTREGESKWALFSGRQIFYKGKPAGLAVAVDITERKAMEDRLRESEERFRCIAERSFDVIFLLDIDGTIRYASPSVHHVFGYRPEQVTGRHFSEFVPNSYMSTVGKGQALLSSGQTVEELQFEIIGADGQTRFVEVNAVPISRDDRVTSLQAIVRDTTGRRRAEQMLQDAYDAQSRQLRQVAGGLAHDVYNDLFPVTTALYRLRQRLEKTSDPDRDRYLRLLTLSEDAIGRAVRLTESVNLYSKMQKSQPGACTRLHTVLSAILEHNLDRLTRMKVRVNSSIDEKLLVGCSQHQLHPLLNNLLLNALDALEDSPERVIDVKADLRDGWVAIDFHDSGGGIAPDALPRIFEPFFSTKPNTGTGLGLAIVRRIVDVYGGTITVQSALDIGTTFSILLPGDVGTS